MNKIQPSARQSRLFTTIRKKASVNIVRKGENSGNQSGHACSSQPPYVLKYHILMTALLEEGIVLTLSSIYTHFNTLKKKNFRKTLWKKVKLLKLSNFIFFHNVFYAVCILKF